MYAYNSCFTSGNKYIIIIIIIISLCSEPKIAHRIYITSSKENVHRNVEEIGELFHLKRLCMEK